MPVNPPPEVNPLEATFCLLQALRNEIGEMREQLDEERRNRSTETAELSRQVRVLTDVLAEPNEDLPASIEKLKDDTLVRIRRLQEHIDKQVSFHAARFEELEEKLGLESNDRKAMLQLVNTRIRQEVAHWKVHAERADREMKEHTRLAEIHGSKSKQHHNDLCEEVNRLSSILCHNTMARDPFRHFGVRPSSAAARSTPRFDQTPAPGVVPASACSAGPSTVRFQTERSEFSRTMHSSCTNCGTSACQRELQLPGMLAP